ncbi:hypothetical protein XELAEV_18017453mg [Xenopus laevis]|uniref:Uncharacterized protein n=1 Tax=Xenopus laevis TaxID=8355 RepID=A0A974DCE4_XENLA|nr:hypothetical protein XELAEV_18017453mg [Xenopus laevis]
MCTGQGLTYCNAAFLCASQDNQVNLALQITLWHVLEKECSSFSPPTAQPKLKECILATPVFVTAVKLLGAAVLQQLEYSQCHTCRLQALLILYVCRRSTIIERVHAGPILCTCNCFKNITGMQAGVLAQHSHLSQQYFFYSYCCQRLLDPC